MEGKDSLDSPHDCGCGCLFFGLCRLDTRLSLLAEEVSDEDLDVGDVVEEETDFAE